MVGPNGRGYSSQTWGDKDDRHRDEAETNGVFPNIWKDSPVYLERELATMLRGRCLHLLLVVCHTKPYHHITLQIQTKTIFRPVVVLGVSVGGVLVGERYVKECASRSSEPKSLIGGHSYVNQDQD